VYLAGGESVLSHAVADAVTAMGYQADRVDTSDPGGAAVTAITAPWPAASVPNVTVVSSDDMFATFLVETEDRLIVTGGTLSPAQRALLITLGRPGTIYTLDAGALKAVTAFSIPGRPALEVRPLNRVRALDLVDRAIDYPPCVPASIALVDESSPTDMMLASTLPGWGQSEGCVLRVVPINSTTGVDPAVTTLLQNSAGRVGTIYLVGSPDWISAAAQQSLVAAVSGPIGHIDYPP
jgi:hypothetical protein